MLALLVLRILLAGNCFQKQFMDSLLVSAGIFHNSWQIFQDCDRNFLGSFFV
jgi:lipopolysaccharide biosynthesis protein